MKLKYEDLISGDAIPITGVGHLTSPHLWQLNPTNGIGMQTYNLYVNILVWDKVDAIAFMRLANKKEYNALNNSTLTTFDAMTLIDNSRELLQKAMAFFMKETLKWDQKKRCFLSVDDNNAVVGQINRENFEEVRDMMLQLNYIGLGKNARPTRHSSPKAEALWKRAQKYLKAEGAKSAKDKSMSMANIISKLCVASASYNLLNVYDLTVFQLYDQFFQCGYLRAMDINDAVFCNHGGKNFDMQAWLKPLI